MRVQLRFTKDGKALSSSTCTIAGADDFGNACADAWQKLKQGKMEEESSIGALMEHLDEDLIELFDGSVLALRKLP